MSQYVAIIVAAPEVAAANIFKVIPVLKSYAVLKSDAVLNSDAVLKSYAVLAATAIIIKKYFSPLYACPESFSSNRRRRH
jgi:hypothetical protein